MNVDRNLYPLKKMIVVVIFALAVVLLGSQASYLFAAPTGDNDVMWDSLLHQPSETVPGKSYKYQEIDGGSTHLAFLTAAGDLDSANIRYWDDAAQTEGWVTMVQDGNASDGRDVWRGTITGPASGGMVYYRLQAVDGTHIAFLKESNGIYTNPEGQQVTNDANAHDGDYAYTVGSGGSNPVTPGVTPTPVTPTPTPVSGGLNGPANGGGTGGGPIDWTDRTAFVHLFEWKWTDIALECENWLGPKGFSAVQVSPPQAHVTDVTASNGQFNPWWIRYQPTSYDIVSRSGDRAQFADMVSRCNAVGVDIYIDAVINHMSGRGGNTTMGTTVNEFDYPAVPFSYNDFHHCGRNGNDEISNYGDPWEVRNCALVGLDDLKTEDGYVRGKIADYLNDLISMGVAGMRIDAAKHMPPDDIGAIKGMLTDPNFYIFQEVIADGTIGGGDYTGLGDVTEFGYSHSIGDAFSNNNIASLQNLGSGMLPSNDAVVFTDNHDNQRGHGGGGNIMNYTWGNSYTLGNVFMLAHPYGYPKVMSSFDFNDSEQGPPANNVYSGSGVDDVSCAPQGSNDWVCEHRWLPIANMVGFRNATNGESVSNWTASGQDRVAFSRGNKGFVAVNANGGEWSDTFQTGLPAGEYCNITVANITASGCDRVAAAGEGPTTFTVDGSGNTSVAIPAYRSLATHVGTATGGGGTFPSASLTAPTSDVAGTFTMEATASHPDGIDKVEFYIDGQLVGTSNGAPYMITLDAADYTSGAHAFDIKAYATTGEWHVPATATYNITGAPAQSDLLVDLLMPSNVNGMFDLQASVACQTTDVTSVDFYIDGTLIGTDMTPDGGATRSATAKQATITVDGMNTGSEWSASNLIARDFALDSAQMAAPCDDGQYCSEDDRFWDGLGRHTWSAHERQVDFSALFATWDSDYLYVAIQGVDPIDVVDSANANGGDFVDSWNMPISLWFDVDGSGGYSSGGDIWGKPHAFAGPNLPDYQVNIRSNAYRPPEIRAFTGGAWLPDEDPGIVTGGTGFTSVTGGPSFSGASNTYVDGVALESPNGTDLLGLGYDKTRSALWEVQIPLAYLGNPDLDASNGQIGIFVGHGDFSSIDTIPDDPATLDFPGISDSNSPLEWGDEDTYTAAFACVGNGCTGGVVDPGPSNPGAPGNPPTNPTNPTNPTTPTTSGGGLGDVGTRTAGIHLFGWHWTDVAAECEQHIGPLGYKWIQVSPPNEHRDIKAGENGNSMDNPWWDMYQPMSYLLESARGTRAEFIDMVERCEAAGVEIVVDAVINHMSGLMPNTCTVGTAGTETCEDNGLSVYPTDPGQYDLSHFHSCTADISNWDDWTDSTECQLVGLDDLDTGQEYVRNEIADFLNDMVSIGVAGFRVDATKHILPSDMQEIVSRVTGATADPNAGGTYFFGEVIQGNLTDGSDYGGFMDYTEFRFANELQNRFFFGSLKDLQGAGNGLAPSNSAVTFVANHDTHRHGASVTHTSPDKYKLAHTFLLAHPYGNPKVMSDFYYSNADNGAPDAGVHDGAGCSTGGTGWDCAHRWPEIGHMAGFRNWAGDAPVSNWWDNGSNQIAFARQGKGFVIINAEAGGINQAFTTSVPDGEYCDVISGLPTSTGCAGDSVTVSGGQATFSVDGMSAAAIHIGALAGSGIDTGTNPGNGGGACIDGTYSVQLDASQYPAGSYTLRAVAHDSDARVSEDTMTVSLSSVPLTVNVGLVSAETPIHLALVSAFVLLLTGSVVLRPWNR